MPEPTFTVTDLLAAASECLESVGYRRVPGPDEPRWPTDAARLYEDALGIVAVVVYETWVELDRTWPEAQATLVEIISRHIGQGDAKAWEGYLVLMTPARPTSSEEDSAERIRYNVQRIRKLIATGRELNNLDDVRRLFLPLLPLTPEIDATRTTSVLDQLPTLLKRRGVSARIAEEMKNAFTEHQPLLDRLHSLGNSDGTSDHQID